MVFAAWPGERPVLSGGRRITGWRAGEINGHACWTADLPEVKGGGWFFTQLFVNGSRRSRPRWAKHADGRPSFDKMTSAQRFAYDRARLM